MGIHRQDQMKVDLAGPHFYTVCKIICVFKINDLVSQDQQKI